MSDFASILPDADSDTINYAQVHKIPILTGDYGKSVTPLSFVFGMVSVEADKTDTSAILLAVDTKIWSLYNPSKNMILIDPSGAAGQALLIVPASEEPALIHIKKAGTSFTTSPPKIVDTGVGKLMLNAVSPIALVQATSSKDRKARKANKCSAPKANRLVHP